MCIARFLTRLGALSFLCFLVVGKALALPAQNIVDAIQKLEAQIENHIEKKAIPGCAVAVVYQNQVVFLRGYGVRTMGKPEKIDVDTVFQLGSVSKPIAATLASVLEQKGLINLDDPVGSYLPNFTLNGLSNPSKVKVKNILSHTTGVPRGGFNNLIENFEPYPKIVRALQTTPMASPVGKKYDYHNAMYSLIGEIAEITTQKPFSQALKTNLLQPLNMNRTSATLEDLIRNPNRATPHLRRKGGFRPATPYSCGYYSVAPAGGINSSARDMAMFLKAQMGGFPQVINNKSLSKLHTPMVPTHKSLSSDTSVLRTKNSSYALGWRILDFADQKLVYHGGWVKGFKNFIAFLPDEKIGIVVLQNGDTHFSSYAAVKFFEVALGLPQAKPAEKSHKAEKSIKLFKKEGKKAKVKPMKKMKVKHLQSLNQLKTTKHIKPKTMKTVKNAKNKKRIKLVACLPAFTRNSCV